MKFKQIINEITKIPKNEILKDAIINDYSIKYFFDNMSRQNSMESLKFFSGMRFINKEIIDIEKIGKYKISEINKAEKEVKDFINKTKKFIHPTIDLDTEKEFNTIQYIHKKLLEIQKTYNKLKLNLEAAIKMKFKQIINEIDNNLKNIILNATLNNWIEIISPKYKSIRIDKNDDGYSWSIKKINDKIIYPTSHNEYIIKYWKKESTAKQKLIDFLKL